jgi:hypothetical protein
MHLPRIRSRRRADHLKNNEAREETRIVLLCCLLVIKSVSTYVPLRTRMDLGLPQLTLHSVFPFSLQIVMENRP